MSNDMAVSIEGMQGNDSPSMSAQTEQAKAFLTRHGVQITEKLAASLRSKPLSSGKLRQAAIIHIDA
ncbi:MULTISPECIES: hypothetical protein [unclassified Paraburkholderia]|uniref:hypothetical protein n=1 Tax=unclassified Paraburkholderia TaxID=2615204 RepID=UPI002AAF8461|nr:MULTISPECIES: hypothetical protein [unclassified Paraburkholderia]